MKQLFSLLLVSASLVAATQPFNTRFERSNGTESPTYPEIISWWKSLASASPLVAIQEKGLTDAGLPLHLVVVSADGNFHIKSLKKQKRTIILVNNGIHPGEPDGIDASMLLVRDIVQKKYTLPRNVVLAIIPVYNIGGALNRSSNYRVDQSGPLEKGFRGNAQNLDLNRDFIKADSRNAFAFARIFHELDPDVFVDNHVSNGADYQHVMTLLTSQHNRLGGEMGAFLNNSFEPALYASMKQKGFDLVPYVNHFGETPEKGWSQYWDSPRYSSGYASLWNVFSFVPETHMLKPYPQRVAATRAMMESFIEFAHNNAEKILRLRRERFEQQLTQKQFPLAWKLDRGQSVDVLYKGYEAGRKTSDVSGLPRLHYDRSKPFEKAVPFYNQYRDTLSVARPSAYILPQGWWKVAERLKANQVQMRALTRDTAIRVQVYRIESYQSSPRPYEGHHPNSQVQVTMSEQVMKFRKGDYFIPLNQKANRFLIETLEPQGEDSYFVWNFFDPILGQKEGFSSYVFEETAADFLRRNPELKEKLEQRKAADAAFAKSAQAQLQFVYQNSPWYEPAHMQYPVFRVMDDLK